MTNEANSQRAKRNEVEAAVSAIAKNAAEALGDDVFLGSKCEEE